MKTEEFDRKIKAIIESEDEGFPKMVNRQTVIDEIINRKSRKSELIRLSYYAAACLLILIALVVFWQNTEDQSDYVDLVENITEDSTPEISVPEVKTDIEPQKITVPVKKKTVAKKKKVKIENKNPVKTAGDSLNNIPKIADSDLFADKNDDETGYIILLNDSIFFQLYQALYQPEGANASDINLFFK